LKVKKTVKRWTLTRVTNLTRVANLTEGATG
jgi:hypothetical protein